MLCKHCFLRFLNSLDFKGFRHDFVKLDQKNAVCGLGKGGSALFSVGAGAGKASYMAIVLEREKTCRKI